MIETTPKTVTLTLKNGRVLQLQELSLFDLADGEKILGRPHDEWNKRTPSPTADEPDRVLITPVDPLKTCSCIVWLMARKEGLTRQEILARKWKFSLDDLMLDMVGEDIARAGEVMVEHFSGIGPT